MKKRISIVVPTFNEEENVLPLYEAVMAQLAALPAYEHELLFIDNASTDATRAHIEGLCARDGRVRAIFNAANFGQFSSPYHGLCAATGDCAILLCADFQDPVEMIPALVAKWEEGHRVVCAVKESSRENPLVRFARTCFYKLLRATSNVNHIPHFTGFGLYDQSFLAILREIRDPAPFLRGIVAEYAKDPATLPYEQQKRRAGKSSNNFFSLYDAAMLAFTTYTKAPIRAMTALGVLMMIASLTGGVFALVRALTGATWQLLALLCSIGFVGAANLLAISVIGEYLLTQRRKSPTRPRVVEERRINFDKT